MSLMIVMIKTVEWQIFDNAKKDNFSSRQLFMDELEVK